MELLTDGQTFGVDQKSTFRDGCFKLVRRLPSGVLVSAFAHEQRRIVYPEGVWVRVPAGNIGLMVFYNQRTAISGMPFLLTAGRNPDFEVHLCIAENPRKPQWIPLLTGSEIGLREALEELGHHSHGLSLAEMTVRYPINVVRDFLDPHSGVGIIYPPPGTLCCDAVMLQERVY